MAVYTQNRHRNENEGIDNKKSLIKYAYIRYKVILSFTYVEWCYSLETVFQRTFLRWFAYSFPYKGENGKISQWVIISMERTYTLGNKNILYHLPYCNWDLWSSNGCCTLKLRIICSIIISDNNYFPMFSRTYSMATVFRSKFVRIPFHRHLR